MIILWNSATSSVSLTIVDGDVSTEYTWDAGRSLAKGMLKFLEEKLDAHDLTLFDISGIGVFRGPGSFTGLRIGLTVLNTLAEARNVHIVGVSGDSWKQEAMRRLAAGENDSVVLPEYGGEAHITKPRK